MTGDSAGRFLGSDVECMHSTSSENINVTRYNDTIESSDCHNNISTQNFRETSQKDGRQTYTCIELLKQLVIIMFLCEKIFLCSYVGKYRHNLNSCFKFNSIY